MTDALARALDARGYDTLTPVQEAVSDPDLAARDLLVSAQTGSGKTVGFGLAIAPNLLEGAEKLPRPASPVALVIAPTRELAMQVKGELTWLYADTGAVLASCVGGMDAREERRALDRGAHIVVATPGRLRDHIERGNIDMTALRAVVLDEADEMLDLGFADDLEFILAAAPDTRRTLLFSATVPPGIARLAETFQTDALRIVTKNEGRQHADIDYRAYSVAQHDAEAATINLLRYHDGGSALVFANTRAAVARLTARLSNRGFRVVSLSGELSQTERSHALQAMRDGRATICVATDVAARGIDLPGLDLVIHAELPSNSEALLHRSGRTGRAGRKGVSALIVPPKARGKAERLLKSARVTAEWTAPPDADAIRAQDEARLLENASWDAPVSAEEAAFAEKLLARRDPQAIAAAYLRLSLERRAAPEDLSPPDAPRAPRERAPFGPATWITLSVGRAQRAEPRWILPLLCRAGDLDKSAIGAIRIDERDTRVEIADAALPGLLAAAGQDGPIEDNVRLVRGNAPATQDAAPVSRPEPAKPKQPEPDASPAPDRPRDPSRWAKPKDKAGDAGKPKPKSPRPAAAKPSKKPWTAGGVGTARKAGGPKGPKPVRPKAGKPGEAPRKPGADAADTSRRFTPPKGRTAPKGGDARPNRKPDKPR